jgi:AbrB family looped-hinge helix DNA binding protein
MSERLLKKVNVVGKGSLSVIIPKRWADALGLKPGDTVSLHFNGSRIILSPVGLAEERSDVGILVELDKIDVALRKLVASYIEGVTKVKVKGDYKKVLELSENLRSSVTNFVLIPNPDSELHDIVFSDVKTDLQSLLKTVESTSKKFLDEVEESSQAASSTYAEFYRKYLYFLRSIKLYVADGELDPYETLDLVVSIEYVKELLDILAPSSIKPPNDPGIPTLLDLARAAIGALLIQDVETSVNSAIKVMDIIDTITCSSNLCESVKYLTMRISEQILGRCIRNKACRCKYFFPKV